MYIGKGKVQNQGLSPTEHGETLVITFLWYKYEMKIQGHRQCNTHEAVLQQQKL